MTLTAKLNDLKAQTRKVWALSLPYFQSDQKWNARAMLALIVVLNLGTVYMSVLVNDWNRVFYDALQAKNEKVFWQEVWHYTYLAFTFVVLAVYKFYVTQLLEIRWRSWMTTDTLRRWMADDLAFLLVGVLNLLIGGIGIAVVGRQLSERKVMNATMVELESSTAVVLPHPQLEKRS